jgi:hypothetical protein
MKKQHTLPISGPDLWKAGALLLANLASGCATSRLSREAQRRVAIQHSKSYNPVKKMLYESKIQFTIKCVFTLKAIRRLLNINN